MKFRSVLAAVLALSLAALAFVPAVSAGLSKAISILTTSDASAAVAALTEYLRSFGIWAPVDSATLMVLQSVAAPIPAFLLTFANGMLFGWVLGAVLSWTSTMAGSALCFGIARALSRPAP